MELKGPGVTEKTKAKQEKPRTKGIKKPYIRPHLVVYGDVAKLTRSGGNVSSPDGTSAYMAGR